MAGTEHTEGRTLWEMVLFREQNPTMTITDIAEVFHTAHWQKSSRNLKQ